MITDSKLAIRLITCTGCRVSVYVNVGSPADADELCGQCRPADPAGTGAIEG